MNDLELGLKLYVSLFESLKKECEPEDYNIDIIREATKKTLEKEIAENGT